MPITESEPFLPVQGSGLVSDHSDTTSATSTTTLTAAADGGGGGGDTTKKWYVLIVCSLTAFEQGWIWNTWGPVAVAAEALFGWSDAVISLFANWGPIMFTIAFLPWGWIMDNKGLRFSSILASSLVLGAAAVRLLVLDRSFLSQALQHLGQMLNGLAGPYGMAIGPLVSSSWFPPHQRTTATAVVVTANMAGVSMSYLIGPLMVKSDGSVTEIQQYLLVALCMSIVPFLLILIHLPSKPAVENAPSITATMARTDFFLAAKQLFSYQQKGFWLLVLAFGIMTGSYQSWGPLYALLVGKLGENVNIDDAQATAGWIGFWSNIASNAGGLVVSVWCDSMHASKKKNVLLGLSLGAVVVLAVFGGLTLHKPWLDAAGLPAIYALCILASIFTQSTCPLFFELAVDEVFPIGEGIATNVLTAMQNLYIMLFLFIPTFGITVSLWVIWLTLGACIISSLALLGFTPALRRTEIDAGQKQEVH